MLRCHATSAHAERRRPPEHVVISISLPEPSYEPDESTFFSQPKTSCTAPFICLLLLARPKRTSGGKYISDKMRHAHDVGDIFFLATQHSLAIIYVGHVTSRNTRARAEQKRYSNGDTGRYIIARERHIFSCRAPPASQKVLPDTSPLR